MDSYSSTYTPRFLTTADGWSTLLFSCRITSAWLNLVSCCRVPSQMTSDLAALSFSRCELLHCSISSTQSITVQIHLNLVYCKTQMFINGEIVDAVSAIMMLYILKNTVSQKTSHLCFAITLTHVNRFWYFLAEMDITDKVSNQKMLYCATSNNLCYCTTWQNRGTQKSHFSLKCCISALPEFNQLLLDFFSLFWLMTHTHAAIWLPKSCSQSVQLRADRRAWFKRKEVESAAAVGLCCMHNDYAPMRCLPERKKLSSVMCLTAFNICWDSKISH